MINQFLKIGGVSNVTDFYKKFPTQEHFEQYMNGGMYAYAGGGNVKESIVDYLNARGEKSDMASRKKRAESMGIKNYTGSLEQNMEMLKKLNPNKYDPEKQAAQNKFVVARPNVPVAGPTLQQPFGNYSMPVNTTKINTSKPKTAKAAAKQKTQEANTAASTNNFQRYPGRGTSFELDYNTYEGRPDQPTTTKTSNMKTPPKKTTASKPTNIEGTKADARYLESGMITDKNKGVLHVVKNGKVIKTIPAMTGLNKDANANPFSVAYLDSHPEARATPVGNYLATLNPDIYGKPGFNLNPISAFGEAAPNAKNTALHTLFGGGPKGTHGYDPAEYKKRMKIMAGPGEKRIGSYGCTNIYGQDIDCLTGQMFPKGDTVMVVDSRRSRDKDFLKKKYGIQKMGGEPCYNCGGMYNYGGPTKQNDTYSAGVSYGTGGVYIPNPAESAYGLPEFMYNYGGVPGMPTMDDQNDRMMGNEYSGYVNQMFYDRGQDFLKEGLESIMKKPAAAPANTTPAAAYGGDAPDGRALVNRVAAPYNGRAIVNRGPYEGRALVNAFADGGVQDLHDAGYNLEYLAQGGPTFSSITQYPHQSYVPAFDWLAYGGPTYSKITHYPHQQYVPALDWMAQGGLVKGSVHDVSEEDIQHLINQGYKIQYL